MSNYETHQGTLTKVEGTKEELLQEFLKNYEGTNSYILKYKGKKELTKDELNELFNDCLEDYIELNGLVYFIKDEEFDDDNLMKMSKNKDGTLDYMVRYYNGCCGFIETLEEAFYNFKRKENV